MTLITFLFVVLSFGFLMIVTMTMAFDPICPILPKKVPLIFFCLVLCMSFWLGIYSGIPYEISKTYIVPVYKMGNSQYIQYTDSKGEHIINLNAKLGRILNDEDKIEITVFSQGPYVGIIAPEKFSYTCIEANNDSTNP